MITSLIKFMSRVDTRAGHAIFKVPVTITCSAAQRIKSRSHYEQCHVKLGLYF